MPDKVMGLDKITVGWTEGADTEGHPGLGPEGMPAPTDFMENKEPAKKTEENVL